MKKKLLFQNLNLFSSIFFLCGIRTGQMSLIMENMEMKTIRLKPVSGVLRLLTASI
jgi:hypothetical protein